MADGLKGLQRLRRAGQVTWLGLRWVVRNEEAFRLELLMLLLLTPLALWLAESGVEAALMIGSLLLVLIVELVNSSIETVVDRIGTERHELSGRAKDVGSAAVFAALVNALVVWMLVLVF